MFVATQPAVALKTARARRWKRAVKRVAVNWELYLLLLPAMVYIIVFKYVPMYGVQIAFRDFDPVTGIWNSPWIGLQQFQTFFNNYQFWQLIGNTVGLSLYSLVIGFPIPIIVALMLHQVASKPLRRVMQTVLYAPHFISTVVVVGMLFVFLSPETGVVNHIIAWMGGQPVYFMASPNWFQSLYVFSGLWQDTGWSTIIYLAALTAVSPSLHEAAMIDGASRWRRIWHIDLPGIRPMIVILLILAIGNVMNIGFEKAYLMQTDLNLGVSEIIPTFVYKVGLLQAQYSYSTAIGMFNAVINLALLIAVNQAAKRFSETSLF